MEQGGGRLTGERSLNRDHPFWEDIFPELSEGICTVSEHDDAQMKAADQSLPGARDGPGTLEIAYMIINSQLMTMNDRVGVAELKARLSEYLRRVRRGETITILDRETAIARILPLADADPLSVRSPAEGAARLQDVPLPPPLGRELDVLELLREERQAER